MGLGYITGNSYRDNQLFQVDVSSIGEGNEVSKYHIELKDSEQISLVELVLLVSREFFSSLIHSFFLPSESVEVFLRDEMQLNRSSTSVSSPYLRINRAEVREVEGAKSQFHFDGSGDHSCTLICFRFLEKALFTSADMVTLLPMLGDILEEGIAIHKKILDENPLILELVGSGELSPAEVDTTTYYRNLDAGASTMCKITRDEKAFFQENLEGIKGRGFEGVLITGRGYTYAIVLNPKTHEILVYDSHGIAQKTPASISKFDSLEDLSSFLAERYPYNQENDIANDFLFLPVKTKEQSVS